MIKMSQQDVMDLLNKHEYLMIEEMSSMLGKQKGTIYTNIRKLREQRLVYTYRIGHYCYYSTKEIDIKSILAKSDILKIIGNEDGLNIKEMAVLCGKSVHTMRRYTKILLEYDLIYRVSGSPPYYKKCV